MKIAYNNGFKIMIVEVTDVAFDINLGYVTYTTFNKSGNSFTVTGYKVDNAKELYNQMLEKDYIDLTMYEPYYKTQTMTNDIHSIDLIKDGKIINPIMNEALNKNQ